MQDMTTAYKIAASIVIICFILTIGIVLMMIGQNFFRTELDKVEKPLNQTADADVYFLSSYQEAVPVAAVWKVLKTHPSSVGEFYIKYQSNTNPNSYVYGYGYSGSNKNTSAGITASSNCLTCLSKILMEHCYFSYSTRADNTLLVDVTIIANPSKTNSTIKGIAQG